MASCKHEEHVSEWVLLRLDWTAKSFNSLQVSNLPDSTVKWILPEKKILRDNINTDWLMIN